MTASSDNDTLQHTPLFDAHVQAGARMVGFAGYAMPVQYPDGIIAEHKWTREQAGLFDVSHMSQAVLIAADGSHETAARALEALVPADLLNLTPGQQRYTQLLNANGGIFDDLMVSRPAEPAHAGGLMLIVNAARKTEDFALIESQLPAGVSLARRPDNALLALQGPAAADILGQHCASAPSMAFMTTQIADILGAECLVSRSGYTGEDGYEISMSAAQCKNIWDGLLGDARVKPVGLGARDSLRLEAGLCLYGHDIDETTSPIEAGLQWSIQKRRRQEGGFPGADRILRELEVGPSRRRVGLAPDGRQPVREGAVLQDSAGKQVGAVTSGGFSPMLNRPIGMGYVDANCAKPGHSLFAEVRGKALPLRVATMPFVPTRYFKP